MHNNATENVTNKFLRIPQGGALQYVYKQAAAELGQAQVRLDDIVEVVIEVEVKSEDMLKFNY